jgi:hypothetical protein
MLILKGSLLANGLNWQKTLGRMFVQLKSLKDHVWADTER